MNRADPTGQGFSFGFCGLFGLLPCDVFGFGSGAWEPLNEGPGLCDIQVAFARGKKGSNCGGAAWATEIRAAYEDHPAPAPPAICTAATGLAPDSVLAVQTVMGENSDFLIGRTSYRPSDTSGSPTGPQITESTVLAENLYMFSVLVNRSGTQGFPGTIGTVATQPGQFAGYFGGALKYSSAVRSTPSSALCDNLTNVVRAMTSVLNTGSLLARSYLFWKAIDQGRGVLHVFKPGDLYVAGTAFGTVN